MIYSRPLSVHASSIGGSFVSLCREQQIYEAETVCLCTCWLISKKQMGMRRVVLIPFSVIYKEHVLIHD